MARPTEFRRPIIEPTPPTKQSSRSNIQWIPWNELSSGQKAGRIIAAVVVFVSMVIVFRGFFDHGTAGRSAQSARAQPKAEVPLTADDRKNGIQSLCKVFQIYGMPKSEADADAAAKNAAELFKLPGNQSPERTAQILGSIAHDFASGALHVTDCAAAGEPMPATGETNNGGAQ